MTVQTRELHAKSAVCGTVMGAAAPLLLPPSFLID